MNPHEKKASIRRLALARRTRIPAGEREVRGAEIVRRLLSLPEVEAADPVLGFVSIRSEVPTDLLLAQVLEQGKRLLLPYVTDDGSLRAAPVASLAEIAPGFRDVPEPRAHLRLVPADPAVIVVPGVAFSPTGARLGYGGGFYDRYLAAAPRVPRVGVCFEAQIFDDIPVEPHDQRVDVIVTDERVIRPGDA